MKTFAIILAMIWGISLQAQLSYQYSWKYYTPGNTGILGDYSEALWLDGDGIPYIAAYTPGWEEGGFSRFDYNINRWENFSNVEYPEIGSIYDVGSSRISDIVPDAQGRLWMATWRGILLIDPAIGGSSLQLWDVSNSLHPGGRTVDLDVAPDGTIWAAVLSVVWGNGGLVQYNPATNQWRYWGYLSTSNNWPSLIGQCEHVTIQPKPSGGYTVWVDGEGWNTMIAYDSGSDLFTLMPQQYVSGEMVSLPGDDCLDEEGNLWALRVTNPGEPFSLDYRKPDGSWVTPAQPVVNTSDIWAFKAYGEHRALITGISSEIWQFDGNSWESRGIWRDGAYTSALDVDGANNIWVSGNEGAARRDASTGVWQRYRITNTSQIDYWVQDISLDNAGNAWMNGNAGPGVGGFQKYDGVSWTGYNEFTYGLGFPFPFPSDNTERIYVRPSNGNVVINPTYQGLHVWNGSGYNALTGSASISKGMTEDSWGRLWNLGEYYKLEFLDGSTWIQVPFIGWGSTLRTDPERPGTVWACSGSEVLRTDGTYKFSREVNDFSELDPQSDQFSSAVPAPDNIAWLGSVKGLFRLDASNGSYQHYPLSELSIPGESVTPLVYTPDGRIWFSNFDGSTTTQTGLGWFDGVNSGFFPVEDGGLPHAQIPDAEVKIISGGYEIWMTCLSRGIAVLRVQDGTVDVTEISGHIVEYSLKASPNPFHDKITLQFSLKQEGPVAIEIFSMTGSLISVLSCQKYSAGNHAMVWDGKDFSGREMPPGAYICRITSDEGVANQTLLRY